MHIQKYATYTFFRSIHFHVSSGMRSKPSPPPRVVQSGACRTLGAQYGCACSCPADELSTANIRVRIYTTAWMGLMKSELLGENVVALRGKKFADGTVKERITLYQDLIGQTTDTKRKFYEGGSDAVANSDTESPSPTK
eukprot:m.215653 g.215653  ORF g.215653 m.215653 type:complete len:139 (+) comp19108_c1_seq7:1031-1447(+)